MMTIAIPEETVDLSVARTQAAHPVVADVEVGVLGGVIGVLLGPLLTEDRLVTGTAKQAAENQKPTDC